MRHMRPLIALSLAGLMTLSACGEDVAAKDDSAAGSSAAGGSNNSAPAKDGGSITVRGCTPQNPLIPSNTNETCGGNVLDAVTARLIHYNPDTAKPEMDIAQSIETKDNQNFTVKIKPGYKFSDGTKVKAQNFVAGTGPPTAPMPSSPATSSSRSRGTPTNSVVTKLVKPSPRSRP